MKNLKKFEGKAVKNIEAVKGGSNNSLSLTGNTNPLLEDMDPAMLDNILADHN
jgi:hypothetical protein